MDLCEIVSVFRDTPGRPRQRNVGTDLVACPCSGSKCDVLWILVHSQTFTTLAIFLRFPRIWVACMQYSSDNPWVSPAVYYISVSHAVYQ